MAGEISYLSQSEAIKVDEDLMGSLGFSIDQLMELAGLSIACAIAEVYKPEDHKFVVFCGPGNNGGDGLVAARHLTHFGYSVAICYPKRTDKKLYHNLVKQCENLNIKFLKTEDALERLCHAEGCPCVVDAMFGFSFKGEPRPPFKEILETLVNARMPIVSVDIPSGWSVERGEDESTEGLIQPEMLVSLTAPKLCAKSFKGKHHYLGGRFAPPELGLVLPIYPGVSQCVRLK